MARELIGRLRAASPRAILIGALAIFLIYAWPGYIGWDSLAHLTQARSGVYTDAHPPILPAMWRLVEVFVAGPAGMLLIQGATLLLGLYGILRAGAPPRAAALGTAAVFLFPPIAGVTAVIVKDALMAGFLACAVALMRDERVRRQRLALVFLVLASAVRWNALAATLPIVVLLFRWRPELAGWRRYAVALLAWIVVTLAGAQLDFALTTRHAHAWYGQYAYQDIAGTLEYADDLDDAAVAHALDGMPLRAHDHLLERFRAAYDPADYRQLIGGTTPLLDPPTDRVQREAIARAWRTVVLGHVGAYLRYRWDNFRKLLYLDKPTSFSNVYVWFHVLAAPETIDQMQHDAAPSRIQDAMRRGAVWLSTTPLYYVYLYLAALVALLWLCRRHRLEMALLLSGLSYELAWFFIDPTGDFRYSQWMVLCVLACAAGRLARRLTAR